MNNEEEPPTAEPPTHEWGKGPVAPPAPYAPRSGPKPIRGPRFSAGPFVVGLGILSLLVVIGIMAWLAVIVLDRVNSDTAVPNLEPGGGQVDPGGQAQPGQKPIEAAQQAKCLITKGAIEVGAQMYEVTSGQQAESIDQLISEHMIEGDDRDFARDNFELQPGPEHPIAVGRNLCQGT